MPRLRNNINREKIAEIREFIEGYIVSKRTTEILSVKGLYEYDQHKFSQYANEDISQKTTWINRIIRSAERYRRKFSREMPLWNDVIAMKKGVKKQPVVIPADDFDDDELDLPVETHIHTVVSNHQGRIIADLAPTFTDQISATATDQSLTEPRTVNKVVVVDESISQPSSASYRVDSPPIVNQPLPAYDTVDIIASPSNELSKASIHIDQSSTIGLPVTLKNISAEQALTITILDAIVQLMIAESTPPMNQPCITSAAVEKAVSDQSSNTVDKSLVLSKTIELLTESDTMDTSPIISTLNNQSSFANNPPLLPKPNVIDTVPNSIDPAMSTLLYHRLVAALKTSVDRPPIRPKPDALFGKKKTVGRPSKSAKCSSKPAEGSKPVGRPPVKANSSLSIPNSRPPKELSTNSTKVSTSKCVSPLVSTPNDVQDLVSTLAALRANMTPSHVIPPETPKAVDDQFGIAVDDQFGMFEVDPTIVSPEKYLDDNTYAPTENPYLSTEDACALTKNPSALIDNTCASSAENTYHMPVNTQSPIETICVSVGKDSAQTDSALIAKDKWDKSLPILKTNGKISPALLFKYLKRSKYPAPLRRPNQDFTVSALSEDKVHEMINEYKVRTTADTTITPDIVGKEVFDTPSRDYQTTLCAEDLSSVRDIYKQVSEKDKIILSTGTVVEDKMKFAAKHCRIEHTVHSMILDLEDTLWNNEASFKSGEKDEILEMAPNEFLHKADTTLSRVFCLLKGKTTFNEIYDAIDSIEAHPHKTPGLYWIKETLMNSLRLFSNSHTISVSDFSDGMNMLNRVFGFVENIKYILNLSSVKGAPSFASSTRKKQTSGSESAGDISSLTLKYNSLELLCVAVGLHDKGINDTQYVNQRYLKTPLALKDFLYEAVNKYPQSKTSIRPVGFIVNGFSITGVYQECTRGSATLVKESARLQFPESLSEFVVKIKPIIHLVYNSIKIMEKNIKACNADNDSYSLGKRKCLITPCYSPKRPKTS